MAVGCPTWVFGTEFKSFTSTVHTLTLRHLSNSLTSYLIVSICVLGVQIYSSLCCEIYKLFFIFSWDKEHSSSSLGYILPYINQELDGTPRGYIIQIHYFIGRESKILKQFY